MSTATTGFLAGPRRFHRSVAVLVASLLAVTLLVPSMAEAADRAPAGRFIVTTDTANPPSVAALRGRGAEDVRGLRHTPDTVVVTASPRAAERLADLRGVVGVEPDRIMHVQHHRPNHCGGPVAEQPAHCNDDGPGDETAVGTVYGVVTADDSAPLVDAQVSVSGTDLASGVDTDGGYVLADVPVGEHAVSATAPGHSTVTWTVEVREDDRTARDFVLSPVADPDDDQITPWGVARIGAPAAWSTTTGVGASVCVADTGIDRSHETLTYAQGRNFHTSHPRGRNLDAGAYGDTDGHGTHVAGTVAARDNGTGVVGVAPGADLLVARVMDGSGGSVSQIVDGLNWCASQGADVINMSFSGGHSEVLADTVTALSGQGIVLVAASGNQGAATPSYPAGYPQVIAVGATDEADGLASFSNRGEELVAPGVGVLSTVPGDRYATWDGTSMAAPHVAGAAALLVADRNGTDGVRSILADSAELLPGGHHLVAASAALHQ